ncbi:S49 family peptidase [Shinella zoogloeoides]|uniref:S49 family peptidase n=1 Tax=Shinella zoogloeoides TaxID=352475 RepID=UPI00273ED842|nr:S49 family peptidase [Shinella zoogloeoides]WLR92173.1 S49 family peptidase [Shinella zoogloeoides]
MNPMTLSLIQGFMQQIGGGGQDGLSPWAIRGDAIAASLQTVRAIRQSPQASTEVGAGSLTVNRRGASLGNGSFATRIGNIAIVPVIGPLVSRFSWQYWSYDEIVRDLRLAESTAGIEGVILDMDTPGGMVDNVDAVPAEIARLREKMPVFAHANFCCSAGYWIASAAEKIIASKTGLVGSVGALIRYVEMEGILTRLGANVVEVIAEQSPNKRLSRDTDEGRAELQAIADDGAELFIQGIVENRGVTRETILENYGKGLVFTAGEAMRRGLVDQIGSLEEVLTEMAVRQESASLAGPATAKSGTEKESTMLTLETLKAEHPDLVSAIRAEGAADAAQAERERLIGIDQQAAGLTGHDDLVGRLKADGKTTPAEAALQLLAAEKTKNAERLTGLQQLDAAAAGVQSLPSAGDGSIQQFAKTPDGWKAEWEATPKLQEDFPTADSYVATMKRKAA